MSRREREDVASSDGEDDAAHHSGDDRSPGHEYGYYELPPPFHGRRWADDEVASRVSSSLADAKTVSDTTDLATLHRLAVEVNKVLGQIKSNWGRLDGVLRPSGPFKAAAPELENQHARLRDLIAERSRPHLRPLRLQDLPPEILANVVAQCERGAQTHDDPDLATGVGARPPGDVATIRSLRLTCRVLAELAAPHLVRVVDVAMTPASLAKLDAISRHPTISGGVHHVRVGLASYPASLKTEWAQFVHFVLRSLVIEAKRGNRASGLCKEDLGKHRARMEEWRRPGAEPPFLVQTFGEYKRRCDEYEAVRAGFGDAVARAVARMRNATRVEVNDKVAQDPRDEWHGRYEPRRENDGLVDEQVLTELLTQPMQWEYAAAYGWGEASDHPVEALRELLVSLGRQEAGLTRLAVNLTPPARYHGLGCTEAEREDIIKAVRGVSFAAFEVKTRDPMFTGFDQPTWPPRRPEELERLGTFMSAALASEELISVILDFGGLRRENQDLWAFNTLLGSAPQNWRNLNRLVLHDPCLSASDLEVLVGERMTSFGIYSPHLTDGSWADVLDMLRDRADPARRDKGETPMKVDGLTQMTGGESEMMTGSQYDNAFVRPEVVVPHAGGLTPYGEQLSAGQRLSPVMRFVSHFQDVNPVRAVL
ncbi:uncharacterized protein ColSpa_06315 [Colletotrichum spaethianum]|uniref:Uncharacterized protein n=1 Tax=Colletotrichum spaethianum TaxID=700344 RepID=A0AA37LEV9_9PEZI|nr:uncharacterized protein ColSpa_06315 [Colletotrichum spaethianum]GKT46134.1 hypothetical protein ColSpa_06315 [Colletotrichum spaethianum]